MVFSSVLFVYLFLPITIIIYYLSKDKYKNNWLLLMSLVFYACGEIKNVFLMLIIIAIDYTFARIIENKQGTKRKFLLVLAIISNLSVLIYYKYFNLGITIINEVIGTTIPLQDIALPIGVSFFTFQALSYVIDVYRKDAIAEKDIKNIGLYISFFPQLVAGPIVRYTSITEQIQNRQHSIELFGEGAKRFLIGFSKKIIIANQLANVVDATLGQAVSVPESVYQLSISSAWIGSICYTLQIFYDFSAYSDMAIGLGKMFGFHFDENFNYPYISKTITEFWRRWHISLSSWFRDYVYIPLGGSRKGKIRQFFNLFVVWMLTGLWHGADFSFVVWGLMYFIILIFEKLCFSPPHQKIPSFIRIIWQIITLLIVNFGWILFNTESTYTSVRYIKAMFGMYHTYLFDDHFLYYIREYGTYLLMGILFSMPIVTWIKEKVKVHKMLNNIISITEFTVLIFGFIWSTSFLILGAHNPFIYFNF